MQSLPLPLWIKRQTLVGAVFWILTAEFFAGQAAAGLAWRGPPAYSLLSSAISDLGVTVCGTVKIGGVPGYYCSPLHDAMNASFILAGIFILLGLYLTRSAFPCNLRSMKVGGTLLALAGIGKIIVGLNPANLNFTLHFLGALGIPLAGVGMIFMARSIRLKWRKIAILGKVLGLAGVASFLLFLFTSQSDIGGLMERLADYPVFAWTIILGLLLTLRSDPSLREKNLNPRNENL